MKNFLNKISIALLVVSAWSCADLDVENELQPDAAAALSNPSDLIGLVSGAAGDVFYDQLGLYGTIHYQLQADILSTTNNAYGFWHVCDQPRRELVNNTGYSEYSMFQDTWDYNLTAISNVNLVIKQILGGLVITNDAGEDVTQETLATAYFVRGVAMGSIGLVYDKGYAILEETELATAKLEPYGVVIEAALTSFDRAIDAAESLDSWTFSPTGGTEYSKEYFLQLCNSYAARFALAQARNADEAAELDYNKILGYANKGITTDFSPTTDGNAVLGEAIYFAQYKITATAAYVPIDQKIAWLADPTQPKDYPEGTEVLGPAQTSDSRIEDYFFYTTDFGYFNASRNRKLFSNYGLDRWPSLINPSTFAGTPCPFMLAAEVDYIKAECQAMLGNTSDALNIINAGPRSTKGGLPAATDATKESIKHLLHYEYSIELGMTGKGIEWAYMRRHDLLQLGTPLHFPVPAKELEILGQPLYTYGSPAKADGVNTATASGSWNN